MWEPVANTEIQPSIDDQSSITLGESNESNYPYISLYNLEKIPFHRGMSMACLNINSLFAHIDELRVFMSNNKVDILCINETKLDSSINDNKVHIPNFEIIRRDRRIQMAVTVAAFAFTLEVILITKYDIIYNLKFSKI